MLLVLAIADCVQNRRGAKAFAGLLWYFPALAAGAFLSIVLASGGHVGSWLRFTAGVADWQFWYYGENTVHKLTGLSDVFYWHYMHRTLVHWIIWAVFMALCLWRLCRRRAGKRTVVFVFLFTSIVVDQVVYLVGSGLDAFTEGIYDLVILLFWALAAKGLLWLSGRLRAQKAVRWGAAGLAAALGVYILALDVQLVRSYRAADLAARPDYVAQLEGVNADAEALRQMAEVVGDEPLFATFASALDDMRGSFQPTGCDYVIHALGDEQQAAYAATLAQGRYPWVQTTNTSVWPWENWLLRASWSVYRQILANYDLQGEYGDWRLWQYAGEGANVLRADVQLQVTQLPDGRVRLDASSDETQPCFLDVSLSWQLSPRAGAWHLGTLRRVLFIADEHIEMLDQVLQFEGYFRPEKGQDVHIPIYIAGGTGSVTLCPLPANDAVLTLQAALPGLLVPLQ